MTTDRLDLVSSTKEELRTLLELGVSVPFSRYLDVLQNKFPPLSSSVTTQEPYKVSVPNTVESKLSLLAHTKEGLRKALGLNTSVPFSSYTKSIYESRVIPSLFSNGEQGVWYNPSDISSLFQDANGTTPVNASGQPVGLMLDKSQGVGEELFSSSEVSLGDGWERSGNVFTKAANTPQTFPSLSADIVEGKIYLVSFTVEILSGDFRLILGSSNPGSYGGPVFRELGIHSFKGVLVANGASGQIVFRGGTSFTGSVSDVSVREIKGNHATQPTAAMRPIYRRSRGNPSVNLLLWSQDFSNNIWVKSGTQVLSNKITAPDGSLTGSLLKATNSETRHTLSQGVTGDGTLLRSIYVKRATSRYVSLVVSILSFNVQTHAVFDFETGNWTTEGLPVTTPGQASRGALPPEYVGGGWYRLTVFRDAEFYLRVSLIEDGSSTSTIFTGNEESVYLWGAQVVKGSSVSPYQHTEDTLGGAPTGYSTDVSWLEFDGVDDMMFLTNRVSATSLGYQAHTLSLMRAVFGSNYSAIYICSAIGQGLRYRTNTPENHLLPEGVVGEFASVAIRRDGDVYAYMDGRKSETILPKSKIYIDQLFAWGITVGSGVFHGGILSESEWSERQVSEVSYYLASLRGVKLP